MDVNAIVPSPAEPASVEVILHCTEGSSNKEYHVCIRPAEEAGLWMVKALYGRIGKPLREETKTNTPVGFDEARKVAVALVASKVKGRYVPVTATSGGERAAVTYSNIEDSGVRLSLLAPIEEAELMRLVHDAGWALQEKHNGERLAVVRRGGVLTGVNKRGMTRPVPEYVASAFRGTCDFTIDGELMGYDYRVFDIMAHGGVDLRDTQCLGRLRALDRCLAEIVADQGRVFAVETATDPTAKAALIARVRAANGEGIVGKSLSDPYVEGRSRSGLKFKFWRSLSAIVLGQNDNKRSVRLGLIEGGDVIDVGSVTVPENQQIPDSGAIVEVRYLEAFKGGSLFQPTLIGVRHDVDRDECQGSQRVFHVESA